MTVSEQRDRMLTNIRTALNREQPLSRTLRNQLKARLNKPTRNVQPKVPGDPIRHFVRKLEAVHGVVTEVARYADVSAVVEAHVEHWGLGDHLVLAPDPDLDAIAWSNRFRLERRAAIGTDRISVTSAFAGVAETGSLVLLSSPRSPTTLNFLPEDHLIVLRADRIVTHLEDVWTHLRKEIGAIPRTVNFITGPSKTADVEQTIQEGAHGPRRLHVILVACNAVDAGRSASTAGGS